MTPTRWLRRPRWQVQELDAAGNVRSDEVTSDLGAFLEEHGRFHTTDYWAWVHAADEAFAQGDHRWIDNPFIAPAPP